MDEIVHAILLGVVQGVSEFLPISSSGHLVIVGELLQRAGGKTFDAESNVQLNVAVHLGTLFSILVVYRRDLLPILRNLRLCVLIVIATIPAAVVGLLFKDAIEDHLFTPLAAGIGLFFTAALLWWSQRSIGGTDGLQELTPLRAAVVGLFQSFALAPGVSRAGSTISGGLMGGLKPEEAARFSFLIAIPVIAGAVVLTARDLAGGEGGAFPLVALLTGAAVSFLVGWISLKGLIGILRRGRLRWFAWYCGAVGAATVAWQLAERFAA